MAGKSDYVFVSSTDAIHLFRGESVVAMRADSSYEKL